MYYFPQLPVAKAYLTPSVKSLDPLEKADYKFIAFYFSIYFYKSFSDSLLNY